MPLELVGALIGLWGFFNKQGTLGKRLTMLVYI
jgi:hypothetical protein